MSAAGVLQPPGADITNGDHAHITHHSINTRQLWDLSWSRIDHFCPKMKDEFDIKLAPVAPPPLPHKENSRLAPSADSASQQHIDHNGDVAAQPPQSEEKKAT